jgi:hypothetical protein
MLDCLMDYMQNLMQLMQMLKSAPSDRGHNYV